jgi:hypothetical protein
MATVKVSLMRAQEAVPREETFVVGCGEDRITHASYPKAVNDVVELLMELQDEGQELEFTTDVLPSQAIWDIIDEKRREHGSKKDT